MDDHVLVKIFKNLSPKDRLRNVTVVNNRFNQLISNVDSLMKGISVIWNSKKYNSLRKFNDFVSSMKQSTRQYQSLEIDFDEFGFLESFLNLHKFQSVTKLSIAGNNIDQEDLTNFVNGFHNLEVLSFKYLIININESGAKYKCKKLKELYCDEELLIFETLPDLVKLTIDTNVEVPEIVGNLDKLEELCFRGEVEISENLISKSKFKLKKLDIDTSDNMPDFTRFLKAQKHLKNLSINLWRVFEEEMLEEFLDAILKHKNLEFLAMYFVDDTDELGFDIDATVISNIKCFHLEYTHYNSDQHAPLFRNMIQRMPNLTELDFYYSLSVYNGDIDFLNNLKMLEKLSIKSFTKDFGLSAINLPNLMEASIMFYVPDHIFIDSEEFIGFLKVHPNLKKLHISGANIKEDVWQFIVENPQHLENFEIETQEATLMMPFLVTNSQFQVTVDDSKYSVKRIN